MLKNMVNAEKKMIDNTLLTTTVGQCKINATGAIYQDITPVIAQGDGYNARNGRSLKFCGMQLRLQLHQQASVHDGAKFTLYVVIPEDPIPLAQSLLEFFDNDVITGIVDYNSNRNPDFMKNYKIIAKKTMTIRPDNYSGAPQVVRDYQFNLKLNHHLRYDKNTSTVTEGSMYLFVVCNTGNADPTNASTLGGIGHSGANTGFNAYIANRFWYYDN